ncbi:MAG TPA: alpha/beta fold hydrolase [Pseudolysinimonas sp.]|jgi:alpha-beta hydrolase superfamily lysophospholipase|nr:alpha/beta fold hydrolase [Pseudolysinimonas sp.]
MTRRAVAGVVAGLAAATGLAALVAGALSVIVARTVIIPPSRRTDDVTILRVDEKAGTILLSSNADSRLPGEYSFWFTGDTGHARLGDIVEQDDRTVLRRLIGVDFGDIATARRGRLSGWFHLSPRDLPYPYRDIRIETPLGAAPAWLVPTAAGEGTRWVINVHGRAVRRSETLRAIRPFREAGFTSLIASYRNDGDAPRSDDYRYALGDREWQDIEAAMQYAVDHGAEELVLMGWSMGGATVLQALTRSPLGEKVIGVVLESPVVDWIATLDFQAALRRLPALVRWGVLQLFKHRWGGWFTGLAEPLDLDRLDFVRRARELDVPILILHSDDDGFVPSTASRALAVARPDIVTYEAFEVARHTKLWNYDRERWEGAISRWLTSLSPDAGSGRAAPSSRGSATARRPRSDRS